MKTHLLLDPRDPGGDAERIMNIMRLSVPCRTKTPFCHQILTLLRRGRLVDGHIYTIQKDILRRFMTIDNARFLPIVLPRVLIGHVLSLAHDLLGHNGISRTYALVR